MKNIILFIFLLFSIMTFSQDDKSVKTPDNLQANDIVLEIKSVVSITKVQEEKLLKHFKNKKDFFSTSKLSELRKQVVLNAYKNEFDSVLTDQQLEIVSKKKKKLYVYITTNY
jgi:hypothetical protein